jgi:alkanesulfonate monooxygenase SsuD/methylene tetrahydromethanopterin reductase-like flavin-dependent oxidoreductase (luciferase family)
VAGLTERIRLGTSIIDALLHVPVVLARRYATCRTASTATCA